MMARRVTAVRPRYLRVVDLYEESRARQLRLSRQVVRAVLVVMLGVGAYLAVIYLLNR